MPLFERLMSPPITAEAPYGPLSDFWYQNVGAATASGVRMNSATALSIATVFACVRIIAGTVAMLPLILYERRGEAKERATSHPLYDVLHDAPNVRQSSFQWRQTLMVHALLRGEAQCKIVPGRRGPVDQLTIMPPDTVTREELENGRIRFKHSPGSSGMDTLSEGGSTGKVGRSEVLTQDEVFFLTGLSRDGVRGISIIRAARDTFGLAYAAEQYGNRLFSQGLLHRHVVQSAPGTTVSKESAESLKQQLREKGTSLGNAHTMLVLPGGLELKQMSMSPDDAQFLETRSFQVEEIASWFGVPLSLLQHTEKSTSWGTGIGQLTLGFLLFTIQPWLTMIEHAISQQLIVRRDRFFAEFLVEGLLRGDTAARAAFYRTMVQLRAMTPNEVRQRENMNPVPWGDEPVDLSPGINQGGAQQEPGQARSGNLHAKATALALDAASRLVRREVSAVRKAAEKHAGDAEGWASWVEGFYREHRGDVAEMLRLPYEVAETYCQGQAKGLLSSGVQVAERWERERPAQLAAIMLEEA